MEDRILIDSISQNIKNSKKYKGIYDKTIERIVGDFVLKFKSQKEIEKKSKNLLHQIWGAFYSSQPDFDKAFLKLSGIYANVSADLRDKEKLKELILPVLKLHSSVNERLPILSEFYQKIFEITGVPDSIIDYACGLNPLTYLWMNAPSIKYQAYDIDQKEVDFLNSVTKLLEIKNVQVGLGDVLCDNFEYSDIVFLLKLLPCLEHQKKNSGLELIKKIPCKYVVVSFPIKSLAGKNVGMEDFYSNSFKKMVENEQWQITEILFETELVFVIEK